MEYTVNEIDIRALALKIDVTQTVSVSWWFCFVSY